MVSAGESNALVTFQVGPVFCCAPSGPVEAIVLPPELSHPPGSGRAHPGIFKHGDNIVSVVDLRERFGVEQDAWLRTGRLIIARLPKGHVGFLVDRIHDVLATPTTGWGTLPPHLPRDVFSRTLLLNGRIHLYAEFAGLDNLHPSGFLRPHIEALLCEASPAVVTAEGRDLAVRPPAPAPRRPEPPTPVSAAPPPKARSDPPTQAPARSTVASVAAPVKPHPARQPVAPVRAAAGTPQVAAAGPRPAPVTLPPVPKTPPPAGATAGVAQCGAARSAPAAAVPSDREPRPLYTPEPPNGDGPPWLLVAAMLLLVLLPLGAFYVLLAGPDPLAAGRNSGASVGMPDGRSAGGASREEEAAPVVVPATVRRPVADATTLAPGVHREARGVTLVVGAPPKSEVDLAGGASQPAGEQAADAPPNQNAPKVPVGPSAPERPAQARRPPQVKEIIHRVVAGDTLWDIAQRYIQDPFRYPELARLSAIDNPDLIYPGDRVRIIVYGED